MSRENSTDVARSSGAELGQAGTVDTQSFSLGVKVEETSGTKAVSQGQGASGGVVLGFAGRFPKLAFSESRHFDH